ncbi:PadR family transcriptional regulator [Rhodococcus wratislaviensis]|uniref:PadR family transcriptional regulator n=1 Tax=Rhodococcus wratislaviensis TaxID=44752 RepID=UPI003662F710
MSSPRRSVLAMAVLSMLSEEPMHAYRMQQLIKERHKDEVVNVAQRNSVYQTIERLLRDGLIEVESTERAENRPERTTYRLTGTGAATLTQWLRGMVAEPAREFPEFPAALAFLPSLGSDDALGALRSRITVLEQQLAGLDAGLAEAGTFLPRLFVVEDEYRRAILLAELDYVRSLADDVAAGELRW